MGEDRLWDDAGHLWLLVNEFASREAVEDLLRGATKVGVHDDYGSPIKWLSGDQARKMWRGAISQDFAESYGIWNAPKAGPFPWRAMLFGDGADRLLVFDRD